MSNFMNPKSIALGLAVGFCLSFPQLRAADAPKKPGPEHKKMEVSTGKWKWEETYVASPFGPAGKAHWKSESKMLHGGFFFEERGSGKGPDGQPGGWTFLKWYDEDTHIYRHLVLDPSGAVTHGTTRVEGSGNVNEWETKKGGKTYKCKLVFQSAPDKKSSTFEQLYSEDSVNWKSQFKGKMTKMR